jgi:hypothetical protein
MPPKYIHLKIIMDNTAADSSSESSDDESLSLIVKDFAKNMENIEAVSKHIDSQILGLYARVKKESVDWLTESLKPTSNVKAWLRSRGLKTRPSIDEFLDACYDAAKTMDLNTRTLTFHKADAAILWNGQRVLTVFDIVARIPTLFE